MRRLISGERMGLDAVRLYAVNGVLDMSRQDATTLAFYFLLYCCCDTLYCDAFSQEAVVYR